MKNTFFTLLCALVVLPMVAMAEGGYPITPVPFTHVKISPNTFWGQRLKASREVTIPLAFSKCEETGRYRNFEIAARQMAGENTESVRVGGFSFDDTDVYKTIEGASYLLQTYRDEALLHYIDSVLDVVATAQEPDGYLYTSRTMNPKHPHDWAGMQRWEKVEELSHEFYNLGHMVEGAIAHYQATGSKKFLDIACRYADCVCREIGEGEGKQILVPGHQIAEMALAKLYTITGDSKYLAQARFFLDKRGYTSRKDAYSQAHKPVVEQDEAVGHAVRAAYMYSGMADVAALTGDSAYIKAVDRIWQNIVGRKMYITGGIGSTNQGEAFGRNYELPNMTAYCETCAAIGNVYVNHRLFLLHGESKYYDVLERTLYNGVISGVSMDGGGFFYPNPLESAGQHQRKEWFGCACCPSNICRFIPSVPGYFYQTQSQNLYVNLYGSGSAELQVAGKRVRLHQETLYPRDGEITITIDENKAGEFVLRLRIPGWAREECVPSDLYTFNGKSSDSWLVKVNGSELLAKELEKGYVSIQRKWKKGDVVSLSLPMSVRTIVANKNVAADRGRLAVQYGPLVYCAEYPDNDFDLDGLILGGNPQWSVNWKEDLLGGINQISGNAQCLFWNEGGKLQLEDVNLRLIPYYAWAHRGAGRMMVWLPNKVSAVHLGEAKKKDVNHNEFFRE